MNKTIKFLIPILLLLTGQSFLFAQEKASVLNAPDDWGSEQISFPLAFAPEINLDGFEDIRFAPGWSDSTNSEFWTYHFTWVLDTPIVLSAAYLENTLSDYFKGLIKTVVLQNSTSIQLKKISNPRTKFNEFEGGYKGTIRFFDAFFTFYELTLNVSVREHFCEQVKKQVISFNLSPKRFDHPVWEIFKDVKMNTRCK